MSTQPDAAQPQQPAPEESTTQPPSTPPPSYQPPTGYGPPPGTPLFASRTNVLAIIALVASFFVGLAGVICGVISLTQIKRTAEKGRGLAIAGIAVGGAQILASIVATIAIVTAAAALSTSASLLGRVEALPEPTQSAGASQECTDLLALLTESRSTIQDLSTTAGTDPQAAVDSLAALSAELQDVAESAKNPAFADAVLTATSELDDVVQELQSIVDDPASASPSTQAEMLEHVTAFTHAFDGFDEICPSGN